MSPAQKGGVATTHFSITSRTILAPIAGAKATRLAKSIRRRGVEIVEKEVLLRLFVDKSGRQVIGAQLSGLDETIPIIAKKEPIRRLEIFAGGPPYQMAINGQKESLSPLPFSVLSCIIARFKTRATHKWPEAYELAEKCAQLREKLDPQNRDWISRRNLKTVWAGWIHATREEMHVLFPHVSAHELIPDGKRSRRCGQRPTISADCVIIGADMSIWP